MALAARNRNLLDYIEALEGERIKILMFSRELPLCLELISQAIEIRRREMTADASSGDFPVLKEFIPLKPTYSSSGSEVSHKASVDSKPDWLRSVQLSSPAAAVEKSPGESLKLRKLFEKEKPCPPPAAEALENIADHRKQRRCWSPELHRKFLDALEQLGGSKSATPKQIKELMKVERLTNDEVKSHLQKYRIHTRRPSTTIQSSSCCISPQIPPQFVLVGGIWVPPPEHAVVATAAEQSSAAFNGIHSYVPSVVLDSGLPEEKHDKQKQLNDLPSRPSVIWR